MITCWKDVFNEYPQRQNKPPYGSEDWQWTLDTMGGGVENVVIPNSVLYYRQDFISKLHRYYLVRVAIEELYYLRLNCSATNISKE